MATTKEVMCQIAGTVEGLTQEKATKLAAAFQEEVVKLLKNGEEVKITGVATLSVHDKAARTGRNPRTGAAIQIAASKVVKAKVVPSLKKAVNE